jgi:hypothetical protein
MMKHISSSSFASRLFTARLTDEQSAKLANLNQDLISKAAKLPPSKKIDEWGELLKEQNSLTLLHIAVQQAGDYLLMAVKSSGFLDLLDRLGKHKETLRQSFIKDQNSNYKYFHVTLAPNFSELVDAQSKAEEILQEKLQIVSIGKYLKAASNFLENPVNFARAFLKMRAPESNTRTMRDDVERLQHSPFYADFYIELSEGLKAKGKPLNTMPF